MPDIAGTYTINLWGSDSIDSCFDRVTVEATGTNTAPNADAGPDQSAPLGGIILLDGSGSSDPDGDAITFSWSWNTLPPDSVLTDADLIDSDTGSPSFTPDVIGSFGVTLEVCDPDGACDTDSVIIEIEFVNTPPTCSAGADQT